MANMYAILYSRDTSNRSRWTVCGRGCVWFGFSLMTFFQIYKFVCLAMIARRKMMEIFVTWPFHYFFVLYCMLMVFVADLFNRAECVPEAGGFSVSFGGRNWQFNLHFSIKLSKLICWNSQWIPFWLNLMRFRSNFVYLNQSHDCTISLDT